jgi:hypothetical protein
MAWEKIKASQVVRKSRGVVKTTSEWAEIMHILENQLLNKGDAMRLRKLPKIGGKNPATSFRNALNKEIKRLDLPYEVTTYGREVNISYHE